MPDTLERKKQRLKEIKRVLNEADTEEKKCSTGKQIVEQLKDEQYVLSREL